MKTPWPALELLVKVTPPAPAPIAVPLLEVKIPLPAVEPSKNETLDPPASGTEPPKRLKVPLPAVDVPKNWILPPTPPRLVLSLSVPPLRVKIVLLPAVALLVNRISPWLDGSAF